MFLQICQAETCGNNLFTVLQTRCLAYADTQRYRLGTNFIQLPVNKPKYTYNPINRDGSATFDNLGGTPNYYPAVIRDCQIPPSQVAQPDKECWNGMVVDLQSQVTEADYVQPRIFWQEILLPVEGHENLIPNVAEHLSTAEKRVRCNAYRESTPSSLSYK